MSDELHAAAAAAREFMKGAEVNENTVLAAHIRREGAQPRGDVWSLAKHYRKQGYPFDRAARAAVVGIEGVDSRADTSDTSGGSGLRQVGLGIKGPFPHAAPAEPSSAMGIKPLDWYPKRFSPGDLDGEGAKKLLGTPSIPLASVLVRETAQNSWDARTKESDVDFVLNMRLLSQGETDVLREVCFPETAHDVDIVESLVEPIWALEISDRGTVGLRGPTRNDIAFPEGTPTNFVDLVFNFGGKHEIAAAGGTYGFGKTVAYKASQLGTVLIWSRVRNGDEFEDRIIGSSISDRFDMDGFRYTGRHWWGRMVDGHIQPLKGQAASALGRAVFSKKFEEGETGTSILVLCPALGSQSPDQDVALLAEAVRWHLWPKLMEHQQGDVRMNIDVQLHGRSVEVFSEDVANPIVESLKECLRAVRAVQIDAGLLGEIETTFPPVVVQEVWCQRPLTLLGHLALQRFQTHRIDTFSEEIVPFDAPARHIALMRNSAELVVKYLPGLPIGEPGFGWMGVFKPVPEMDSVFASSEPPAHDDWVPDGVEDRWGRTQVRVGLRQIRSIADSFAQPTVSMDEGSKSESSVAGIADALADLVPLVAASRPEPRASSGGGSGARKPKVQVTDYVLGPVDSEGNRVVALELLVSGAAVPVELVARTSVGVEGGTDNTAGGVEVVGWSLDEPDWTSHPTQVGEKDSFRTPSDICWVVVRTKVDLALDVQIDVVA